MRKFLVLVSMFSATIAHAGYLSKSGDFQIQFQCVDSDSQETYGLEIAKGWEETRIGPRAFHYAELTKPDGQVFYGDFKASSTPDGTRLSGEDYLEVTFGTDAENSTKFHLITDGYYGVDFGASGWGEVSSQGKTSQLSLKCQQQDGTSGAKAPSQSTASDIHDGTIDPCSGLSAYECKCQIYQCCGYRCK